MNANKKTMDDKKRKIVLYNQPFVLKNRLQAGQLLGQGLKTMQWKDPLVAAIPRGGLPIAVPIAEELDAELDMILLKKIGAPGHSEFAIGSVDEKGEVYLMEYARQINASEEYIRDTALRKVAEMQHQYGPLRRFIPSKDWKNRDVIIVDDGVATGSSLMTAIRVAKNRLPNRIIAAVPVTPKETMDKIAELADAVVALMAPEQFMGSVGFYYQDFTQVTIEEIEHLLHQFNSES